MQGQTLNTVGCPEFYPTPWMGVLLILTFEQQKLIVENVHLGIKRLFSRLENANQRATHTWSLIGRQSLHVAELSAIYSS